MNGHEDGFMVSWAVNEPPIASRQKFYKNQKFKTLNDIFFNISFNSENQLWLDERYAVLFSGYHIDDLNNLSSLFLKSLAYMPLAQRTQWLCKNTGYFSLVIIDKKDGGVFAARDKYGCKTLYCSPNDNGENLSNYLYNLVTIKNNSIDPVGLYETLHYRWLSGDNTLNSNIKQVPASHYIEFTNRSKSLKAYWNWTQLEVNNSKLIKLKKATDLVEYYLDEYFVKIAPQVSKVLIPLSAGVDSSVLAAKAFQHLGDKCVAGIISFDEGNIELDTAKHFANSLGMKYRVIHFSDSEVTEYIQQLVPMLGQLPRHYSSMPFSKLLNHSDEFDAIIYGEPGDTFFGSHTIKRLLKRFSRIKMSKSIPDTVINGLLNSLTHINANKLRKLKSDSIEELFHTADKIAFSADDLELLTSLSKQSSESLFINNNLMIRENDYFLSLDINRQLSLLKNYMLITDISDHIVTADRLIKNRKLKLLTPLTYQPIEQISWSLEPKAYLGGKDVKRVLREIGCKFYGKKSMYAPKFGFNTPTKKWLEGLRPMILDTLKDGRLVKQKLIPASFCHSFHKLSIEMIWTLYHLELYMIDFQPEKMVRIN